MRASSKGRAESCNPLRLPQGSMCGRDGGSRGRWAMFAGRGGRDDKVGPGMQQRQTSFLQSW